MRRGLAGILVIVLTCAGLVAWAQQGSGGTNRSWGQSQPGPGSGVVTVEGTVKLANGPGTTKEGDWRVAIANTPSVNVANAPSVSLAPLAFVTPGKRYQIVWSTGETEQIAAAATGAGAWVRVTGPERWVNLAMARSVAMVP
jgi:hypothetical protein